MLEQIKILYKFLDAKGLLTFEQYVKKQSKEKTIEELILEEIKEDLNFSNEVSRSLINIRDNPEGYRWGDLNTLISDEFKLKNRLKPQYFRKFLQPYNLKASETDKFINTTLKNLFIKAVTEWLEEWESNPENIAWLEKYEKDLRSYGSLRSTGEESI